jgi:hypothetical protein
VSGRQGRPGSHEPGVCSTGLATLRRDGFASMDFMPDVERVRRAGNTGELTTRLITFNGAHLFVNADARRGELRAEILDAAGNVIAPFSKDNSIAISTDGTRQRMLWKDGATLAMLKNRPVRLKFSLSYGRLYAFWISSDTAGRSGGYPAAGGPEFSGPVDRANS